MSWATKCFSLHTPRRKLFFPHLRDEAQRERERERVVERGGKREGGGEGAVAIPQMRKILCLILFNSQSFCHFANKRNKKGN